MNVITDSLDYVVDKTSTVSNTLFANDFFRLASLILAGVFAGYTLQPVPRWLNRLFDTSVVFKFFVITVIGITAVYPLNKSKFVNVVISAALLLAIFEVMRGYDKPVVEAPQPQEEVVLQENFGYPY
jgi:hypothetical protein